GVSDPSTAARVGQLLGAEYLVLGSYFELMGQLRIDARVVRVETGEVVVAEGGQGRSRDLWTLQDELADNLHLGLTALHSTAAPAPRTTRGASDAGRDHPGGQAQLAAALAYSEGLI